MKLGDCEMVNIGMA